MTAIRAATEAIRTIVFLTPRDIALILAGYVAGHFFPLKGAVAIFVAISFLLLRHTERKRPGAIRRTAARSGRALTAATRSTTSAAQRAFRSVRRWQVERR